MEVAEAAEAAAAAAASRASCSFASSSLGLIWLQRAIAISSPGLQDLLLDG